LSETKPEFIKTYLKTIESENQVRLNDMIESLKDSEARKKIAEEKNKDLKDKQKVHEGKVCDC
jgi:hypothetical protein